jgi:chemotaxis signal transduction protein
LSTQLRRGLAQPSAEQTSAINQVLGYINSLYTVYARLFVYDRSGRIIATTGGQEAVGEHISSDTLSRVVALRSELDHYPEPFAPSALYGGESTYIYHAAIRHPEQTGTVIGGIGIVFDSTPELLNMLHSGVASRTNMRAYFVTPEGRVLSSTDSACAPGDLLQLDARLLEQANQRNGTEDGALTGVTVVSRIMRHDGQYVLAACTRAAGYREFRSAEGVEQPVIAVLLQAFGPIRASTELPAQAAVRIERLRDTGADFAIFYAGRTLMALRATQIQEAVPFAKVQRTTSGGHPARMGMLDVPLAGGKQHFVWVFDLALLATGKPGMVTDNSQVMLVHLGQSVIGLLVDDLHSVHQFDTADMTESPLGGGDSALAPRLIKANHGDLLIQEIDIERLFARLRG